MALVTVANMIANARLYADERATAFISDAEILRLVNHAIAEHRDLILAAQGPAYYEKDGIVNTTVNGTSFDLPADFSRMLSIHADWSGGARTDLEELEQLKHLADRDIYINEGQPWTKGSFKAVYIGGQAMENSNTSFPQQLHVFPKATVAIQLPIKYVKDFTDLGLSDSLWITNGHDRMICLRVACEIRNIQGLPTTFLERRYEADRARIEEAAMNRSNEPSKVRDVEGRALRPGIWRRLPRVF